MRKLKVPQPYASMVVSGLLNTLPNPFGEDITPGEDIFIYADMYDENIATNGYDILDPLHQKICNEIFYGNINPPLPTECFIGRATVKSRCPKSEKTWPMETPTILHVENPKEFIKPISDFFESFLNLSNSKTRKRTLRYITRKGNTLYVPIGKETFDELIAKEKDFQDIIFWEEYMKRT